VTFRNKLFVLFMVALLVSIGLIAAGATILTRRSLEESNHRNSEALLAQFQREFERRGQDAVHQVQSIADAESTVRMAIDLMRPHSDVSVYVNDARGVSQSHQLDFLDFVSNDGSIISSNEWPTRFGNKMDWLAEPQDWAARGSFLMKVDTQDGPALGLMSVATVRVGDKDLYVLGGERVGKEFLSSLSLPPGIRALLYLNLDPAFEADNVMDDSGAVVQGERFARAIEEEQQHPGSRSFQVAWTADAASAEAFQAVPLLGRQGEVLGVLLVGSARRGEVLIERRIAFLTAAVAALGLLFALLLRWWGAAAVTRPVRQVATGLREVGEGKWRTRVDVHERNEIGQLGLAFNAMTERLSEQREGLLQTERATAWREVARRLAEELKNPMAALQSAAENIQHGGDENTGQQDDVLRKHIATLLPEIEKLKAAVSRFGDFGSMQTPEFSAVDVNQIVRTVVKGFEAQFGAVGRPPITPELHLEEDLPSIQGDAALLRRALENLVLNAMDAMPAGGVVMLRTTYETGNVQLEISDTGSGMAPEECERLFTPYYTTKQHGTGLGLAVVQSIVSDHGGRISVDSEAGVGTSFRIILPTKPPLRKITAAASPEKVHAAEG
jgi:two-component system, NtrC family, nitrogen regulation sensor histidine kinase NtrY